MNEQINQWLIRVIMLSSPLLRGLGINTSQLEVILQTKCRLDDRRPVGLKIYQQSKRQPAWLKNILFFIFGFLIACIFFIANPFLAQALYLTAIMAYSIGILITDFSNVLIDVRDHYFIVSRPVDDKTVAVARFFHILLYLCKTFIPFYLPGIIIVFLISGVLTGLLFLVEIAVATILGVFAVYIIYMVMLQFIKPQRFRDIIAYFQIAFSVLIFGGYIIFPQLTNFRAIQTINPLDYTVSYFLPPVWLASLQHWITGPTDLFTAVFTALSILTPILCLAGITRIFSGNFSNKLTMMGAASTTRQTDGQGASAGKKPLSERLAPLFTYFPLEQLGFKITWKLSSRLTRFKSRVYPSFAFIIIYFIYWAFISGGDDQSFVETWQHLPQTSFYLFLLYAIGYMSIIIIMQITYSDNYRAAWFYQMSSTQKPGLILSGMIKSLVVKYMLPSALVSLVFIFWVWGADVWLNVIFALINIPLITIVIALIKARKFPFSEETNLNREGGKRFLNIFLILIPMGLGFFQSVIAQYTYLLIILSVVYAAITWALFRVYQNISWNELLDK